MSEDLTRLVAMADVQIKLESDIEEFEAKLKERKDKLRKVSEEDLPDLMMELGVTEFKLSSGRMIKLKEDIRFEDIENRKQKLPQAIEWLVSHGFGGIIKSAVITTFGKGEKEKAESVLNKLKSEGYAVSMEEGINTQTLKAFINERIKKKENIPLDKFGAYPFHRSVITEK